MRALAALALIASTALADPVPEPADYRMEDFRAPVPETLAGAEVLSTEAAHALWQSGEALWIDVLPKPPKPANLPKGTLWIDRKRPSIPGAHWLPNVGYGRLNPEMDGYFRDNLARLAEAPDRHVVFFCLDDCWMSWNAARRAMLDYGYNRVAWYPEGTDGWDFMDYPLEIVEPEP